MLAPRQQQRIDEAFARKRRPAGALELGIEEAQVERSIVGHQRSFADERDKLLGHVGRTAACP